MRKTTHQVFCDRCAQEVPETSPGSGIHLAQWLILQRPGQLAPQLGADYRERSVEICEKCIMLLKIWLVDLSA